VIASQPTLWVDVGSFLEFFRYQERPTGIQRAEMEIFAALARSRWPRGAIRFCRLERSADRFESVEPEMLQRVFYDPPVETGSLGRRVVRSARRMLRQKRLLYWRLAPLGPRTERFRPGDVLVCLGTSWENPRYGGMLARARELGVRIAVLIYDIIPVAYPQWVEIALRRRFGRWLDGILASADLLLTISAHSRATLLRLGEDRGIALPPVEILWLGSGFSALATPARPGADPVLPEGFVLYVSTLEPRKNHGLLLRLWRRLQAKHGASAVPSLVFVGRRGWLVDDLLSDLSREAALRDKVAIMSGLSDAELARAYRRCLFTIFPSLMEGWGLPVTESLEQGKLCVASNRGAIPEAGGDLVDYFDPEDEAGALAIVERAIFDRDYRHAREARIRREFRHCGWGGCAAALIAHLDRLGALRGGEASASEGATAKPRSRASLGVSDVV
jgi:glycosyltransferase involved in cell wall biosynthesis